MRPYHRAVSNRHTPITEALPGREADMEKNAAGGVVFTINPMQRVRRFLILGTEGGTYYTGESKLTRDSIHDLRHIVDDLELGKQAVAQLNHVAKTNVAPKKSPSLFFLALLLTSTHREVRVEASKIILNVARTHSHLCEFVSYVDTMRGWGRLVRQAIRSWYNARSPMSLAYQFTKYRQRNDWTAGDILRKVRPTPQSPAQSLAFRHATSPTRINPRTEGIWALEADGVTLELARYYQEFEALQNPINGLSSVLKVLENDDKNIFTWEMVPTEYLREPTVWRILIDKGLPPMALIRNLGRLSNLGLTRPLSTDVRSIIDRLTPEALRKANIHPYHILQALVTYKTGRGARSDMTWPVNSEITRMLDDSFLQTFENVPVTGKRIFQGVDVSGSMWGTPVLGSPNVDAATAAAAMALITATVEPRVYTRGFSHRLVDLPIAGQSLSGVLRLMNSVPMGMTDCALPMIDATKQELEVDAFVIYTDNETWVHSMHPIVALDEYNKHMGRQARLAVVAFTGTRHSIADPNRTDTLDLVGFDSSGPKILGEFISGDF